MTTDPNVSTDDDLWPSHARASGVRMRVPTAALLALLIAAGGAWGGAELQKHHGAASASSNGAANPFAAFRQARAAGGAGAATFPGGGFGGRGGPTPAAAGTVTLVQGNTVWLTSASGALVKVVLTKATTLTRSATALKTALRPGDTAIVQGTKKAGVVTATSLTATAKSTTAATSG